MAEFFHHHMEEKPHFFRHHMEDKPNSGAGDHDRYRKEEAEFFHHHMEEKPHFFRHHMEDKPNSGAAGAFAMYDKPEAKKDPEKVPAAVGTRSTSTMQEKKDAEEAEGKKHHFF